jgi:hypothetical protein
MQSDDRQSRSHAVGNDRAMDLPEKTNLDAIRHEGGRRYTAGADSILIRGNRGTSIHDKELQIAFHAFD